MTSRGAFIGAGLVMCVALGAAISAQQPRITNAQLTTQPAASLKQTFAALLARQTDVAWIGYMVPARDRNHRSCCWDGTAACHIEPSDASGSAGQTFTTSNGGPVKLEGPERTVVLFRVVNRRVERIRAFSEDCELDAGGRPVHWLDNVQPSDSVALLESFVGPETDKKTRLTTGAFAAISMHGDASAAAALERLARSHAAPSVRGDALFWLAQMAGAKVAAAITDAIANDPDTDVKKRAVFALSRLPRDESVPLLIDVARRHANPAVKRQAIFWLGQSKDPRAIDFFAQILK